MAHIKNPGKKAKKLLKWGTPLWAIIFILMLFGTLSYYGALIFQEAIPFAFGGALPLTILFGALLMASVFFMIHDEYKAYSSSIVEHAAITINITEVPTNVIVNPLVVTKVHKNKLITATDQNAEQRIYAQVQKIIPPLKADEELTRGYPNG